ncbi:hypothetical protein D4764_07G0000530 [Takifugu flavidus]|uniref:Uncharacterized protein n=1 Tax=Takifugu flavidus TaxID=433684 RepID=A0A5C6MPW6_9TELE|nr:hypothetical protein D4764_07G0000530 [Takifugu flavidus]
MFFLAPKPKAFHSYSEKAWHETLAGDCLLCSAVTHRHVQPVRRVITCLAGYVASLEALTLVLEVSATPREWGTGVSTAVSSCIWPTNTVTACPLASAVFLASAIHATFSCCCCCCISSIFFKGDPPADGRLGKERGEEGGQVEDRIGRRGEERGGVEERRSRGEGEVEEKKKEEEEGKEERKGERGRGGGEGGGEERRGEGRGEGRRGHSTETHTKKYDIQLLQRGRRTLCSSEGGDTCK